MHPALTWSDKTSPRAVELALTHRDRALAGALLDSLCSDLDTSRRVPDANATRGLLGTLRKFSWFGQLQRMAQKFEEHAQDDIQVMRQLAQTWIELDELSRAIGILQNLTDRIDRDLAAKGPEHPRRPGLLAELSGVLALLGCAYKRFYINSKPLAHEPRQYDLANSLSYYERAFALGADGYLAHGTNALALLAHRHRISSGNRHSICPEAANRARQILQELDGLDELTASDLALRIEAHLALGNLAQAVSATPPFLDAADTLSVLETGRQLREVWSLTEERAPGNEILPMMNARVAQLGPAPEVVELAPNRVAAYNKVHRKTGYHSVQFLIDGLKRSTAIAQLGRNKYERDGTGFLIDGAWIGPEWANEPLLLTNAHICSDDPIVRGRAPYPEAPEWLTTTFSTMGGTDETQEIRIRRLLWSSPPHELDATLLLLEEPPKGCEPIPRFASLSQSSVETEERVNILGHHGGRDMCVSLQDNKVISLGQQHVLYRTPTDPSSSGSPVFNQNWELVALHRASRSNKQANEGVRIDVVIETIRGRL